MKKRLNPLFADQEPITASDQPVKMEPVEAAGALSPLSRKPMRKVMCGNIPAYYDPENRLVLPIKA